MAHPNATSLACAAVVIGLSVLASPMQASAFCMTPDSQDCENAVLREAERNRADALGIESGNPFEAFSAWISGNSDGTVLPPISTLSEAQDWMPGGKYLNRDGTLREGVEVY